MVTRAAPPGVSLPGYAVFAAMLSAAGLPIYIHAPAHYASSYGVGLTALAGVLFALRLIDVVQDPVLGWLAARLKARRELAVGLGVIVLAGSMLGLFAVTPPVAPLLWFGLMMVGLFSAFSFLTISMYAEGVQAGPRLGASGHLRLAGWRETGALLGVCAAAVAPTVLVGTGAEYAWFAVGFAGLCLLALILMRGQWGRGDAGAPTGFRAILSDAVTRRLLLIALLNAAPVAVSSTLFLFYVGSVLDAPGWEGPLLVLFFLAAAGSAPVWSRLATRFGERPMLLSAMALAIASLLGCPHARARRHARLLHVCLVSGAALGADFAILPALFSPGWRWWPPRRARPSDSGPSCRRLRWRWRRRCCCRRSTRPASTPGGRGKRRGGADAPDEALCAGALHPETGGDGASGVHPPAAARARGRLTRKPERKRDMREWSGKRYWLIGRVGRPGPGAGRR
jgi:GPH family glycoside/pentoside/hexuronide:cation symporter